MDLIFSFKNFSEFFDLYDSWKKQPERKKKKGT